MKEAVGILSLGCPRNLVDAEAIAGRLSSKGYAIVDDLGRAQIALVNTCAFIEEAKKESIDAILELIELKKQGRINKIIVCGCLVERYKQDLSKQLPEVDAFVGRLALDNAGESFSLTPSHYAYLKICEGCVNNCSYCVIPAIKGRFRSMEARSLIKKAAGFDRRGVAELNIIGQDISAYGIDLRAKPSLARILKKIIGACAHIGWIRLLYLHPKRISDELLGLIQDEPQLCKYIDLPLQHINERILKLMRRDTGKKEIMRLIEKIRKRLPTAALRTTFIVGFPSETEAEFEELLDFVKEARFERLGVFTYSREEATPAYAFEGQLPARIKRQRLDVLMRAQQSVSGELNSRLLGKVIKVLIEEKSKGAYLGRSQFDAPEVDGVVYVKSSGELKPGEFVKAKIVDTLEYDLVGELLP